MKSFKEFISGSAEKKYEGPDRRSGPRRTKSAIPGNIVKWGGRRTSDQAMKEHNYISEKYIMDKPIHTKTITGDELLKHIGRAKIKSIHKHPFHQEYISGGHAGYQYHRSALGHEHVLAAPVEPLNMKDGTERRRMVQFELYKNHVDNAHLFHNKDNERHRIDSHGGGNRIWRHIRSHKEDEE